MEALREAGAKAQASNPEAMEEAQSIYISRDDLSLCGTKEGSLCDADALVSDRYRMAGVPRPGLRPDPRTAGRAGDLRWAK